MRNTTTNKYLKVLEKIEALTKNGYSTKNSLLKTVDTICKVELGYSKSVGNQFVQSLLRSRMLVENQNSKVWNWNLRESANHSVAEAIKSEMNRYQNMVMGQKELRTFAGSLSKRLLKSSTNKSKQ